MSNDEDVRPGVALTSRYLTRHGVPVVPVSGEIHYSRVPRHRWRQRLRQMRSGGVTVIATYVFWLHHVAHRGSPRFDGNLDVAAFVDLCADEGFDVVLRIGPWCHGETRNGGFPDWVQRAPVRHRTDDPAYLDLVREWFGQLGAALGGRGLLGVQLENELYDQPGHIVTLKRLARAAGLAAPLWTATAWGGADLPELEVLPLYGGYGDGFWVDADAPWDPTFRDHYFFSHVWDDPGIGADLRRLQLHSVAAPPRTPSRFFPPATCELGGGMATAYHRRPRPAARDIATIAHCKIGNGSAWQGYYMYAGGTNPVLPGGIGPVLPGSADPALPGGTGRVLPGGTGRVLPGGTGRVLPGGTDRVLPGGTDRVLPGGTDRVLPGGTQESHATGYPNDMPPLGYDFHAPIGEAGVLAASHAELRRQHAFLAAFGAKLAEMPSSLPDTRPTGVDDDRTLRWALRSDGESGFLFIAWHQPHVPLPTYRGASFRVTLDRQEIVLPGRPLDIPAGTLARWPIGFEAGGVRLDWATASALTLLPGAVPTLVLLAENDIPVSCAVGGTETMVEPAYTPTRLRPPGGGELDLLILPASSGPSVWVCENGPARRLILSPDELSWGPDGRIRSTGPTAQVYNPQAGSFASLPLKPANAPWRTAADDTQNRGSGSFSPGSGVRPPGSEGLAPGSGVRSSGSGGFAPGSGVRSSGSGGFAPGSGVRPSGGGGLSAENAGIGLAADVEPLLLRAAAGAVPVAYGKFDGRQSAPSPETFEELAAVYRVVLPDWAGDGALDAHLRIVWAGDVGQLRVDGRTVTDRFWDGSPWIVNLRDAGFRPGADLTLHLLPLATGSPVSLPHEARDRLATADGQLLAIDELRVVGRPTWQEIVTR